MKGNLIYSALVLMAIVFIIAAVVADIVSILHNQRREKIRGEEVVRKVENTMDEAINFLYTIPYEDIHDTEGIHDELMNVNFPEQWKMVNENCGFIATLISFSGDEVVWEIWARCCFADIDKIEKAKVKYSMAHL